VRLPTVRGLGAVADDAVAIQSAIDSIANPDQLTSAGDCTAGGEVILNPADVTCMGQIGSQPGY
jgi:hypothetical protein